VRPNKTKGKIPQRPMRVWRDMQVVQKQPAQKETCEHKNGRSKIQRTPQKKEYRSQKKPNQKESNDDTGGLRVNR
jgi:hypothetical protein